MYCCLVGFSLDFVFLGTTFFISMNPSELLSRKSLSRISVFDTEESKFLEILSPSVKSRYLFARDNFCVQHLDKLTYS